MTEADDGTEINVILKFNGIVDVTFFDHTTIIVKVKLQPIITRTDQMLEKMLIPNKSFPPICGVCGKISCYHFSILTIFKLKTIVKCANVI